MTPDPKALIPTVEAAIMKALKVLDEAAQRIETLESGLDRLAEKLREELDTRQGEREVRIKNEATWKRWIELNTDPYGKAVIDYAARWANLMETEMMKGGTLDDFAKRTSHEADTEGITGFMYGAAVSVLSSCWEHGEQLRRWHNLDCQIESEGEKANKTGGMLNPALLNIGVGEKE